MSIKNQAEATSESFGYLLNMEVGEGASPFGIACARPEASAVGSIYCILLHGHEPYETEDWENTNFSRIIDRF